MHSLTNKSKIALLKFINMIRRNITSINFSRQKPIHKRSNTREYSNLSDLRPKTSNNDAYQLNASKHSTLKCNIIMNLESYNKLTFKNKEYFEQNFPFDLNHKISKSRRENKSYNSRQTKSFESAFNTVDEIK